MANTGDRDLRPYPEYKDSGLPWLGRVPAHWDVRRNGRLFAQRNETGYGSLPILEVSLKTGVRVRNMDDLKRKQVMSDREKYKRAVKGDIAYNMMRMWQGAVGVAPEDGLVSPAYVVARPYPEVEPRYFSYLFRTDIYKNEVDGFSRGIVKDRNRLYWEDFKQMSSCFPPLDEQKAIADYLDANAAQVRRFIRNRRRLVEVLNEQKQAIISRAVTRGIDPNVPLKPSGIDWLGDIPACWKAVRLKHVSRVQTGITLGKTYLGQQVEERPYLRVANVQTNRLDLRLVKTLAIPASEIAGSALRPGDVLTTEGGDIDKLARGCVWRGEVPGCLHQNHIFAVRPDQSRLLPEYLVALMASRHGRIYFERTAKRTTNLASTNSSTLGAFPLLLPDVSEQTRILQGIAGDTQSLDAATNHAQREIDLIREYRTRLIADVVTGKVDVRHLAPACGDDPALPEPDDLQDAIDDDEVAGNSEDEPIAETADQ